MNIKKIIFYLILLSGIATTSWFLYKKFFTEKKAKLFKTDKPQVRTILQSIKTTGYLEVKDMMKIGSLVQGVVEKMLVEENEIVKKGQLIALVDDGQGDTQMRRTKGNLKRTQAELFYLKAHYEQQKELYESNQISKNEYQKILSEYETKKADVFAKQGTYDYEKLVFFNKHIKSPEDGMVIGKIAREGETVTLGSPPTLLYTIARHIDEMEAKLEIDENVIDSLRKKMHASLIFDTYPHKHFKGTISEISNASIKQSDAVSYLTIIPMDNSKGLFRPGMSVNAIINVAEKGKMISVARQLFKINKSMLKEIAPQVGYGYKELDHEEKKKLETQDNMKTVWIVKDKTFIERPIEIGINDNASFEVTSGLTGDEDIVVDTVEPDTMKEMFSKFFDKGLAGEKKTGTKTKP